MATKTAARPVGTTIPEQGYKQHIPGRRKGKVHELFDKEGPEAAWTLGRRLRLKEGTLRSWFAQWRRTDKGAKSNPKGRNAKSSAQPPTKIIAQEPTVTDAVAGAA
jgi:hypothetical protein